MIKHIVFWKIKNEFQGMNKFQIQDKMVRMLEALPVKISQIKEFEVGKDLSKSEASYEISLFSAFETKEDLKTYANHPDHLKVVEFFKQVVIDRAVVDYEV